MSVPLLFAQYGRLDWRSKAVRTRYVYEYTHWGVTIGTVDVLICRSNGA